MFCLVLFCAFLFSGVILVLDTRTQVIMLIYAKLITWVLWSSHRMTKVFNFQENGDFLHKCGINYLGPVVKPQDDKRKNF